MSTPGTGGLPQRRPDQQRTYSAPTAAPGAAAGIIRARIVEIIGGTGSGIFVYSGTPAAGDLIASLVGDTTADPFGNGTSANGLAIYGTAAELFMGLLGGEPALVFYTGATFEGAAGNIFGEQVGSGASALLELLLSGPKASAALGDDWVQVMMQSANEGNTSRAQGTLIYIDTGGTAHASLIWGENGVEIPALFSSAITGSSINGINPGPFTLSFGQTAGAAPSGSGTAVADAVAGALNVYMVALAAVVTANGDAINDIVNGLDGWGV